MTPARLNDPKPRPNHPLYIQHLRRLSPEQRLLKAFEFTERTRELLRRRLRRRYPHADAKELKALFLEELRKCHNRNH